MKSLKKIIIYRRKLVEPYVRGFLRLLRFSCYILGLMFLLSVVADNGFETSPVEIATIDSIRVYTWIAFMANTLLHYLLGGEELRKRSRFSLIMNVMLFLPLIGYLFAEPLGSGTFDVVWHVLHSKLYIVAVLSVLSIMHISNGVVRLLGKRIRPSLIFALSFLVIILLGTGLLMLPLATVNGISFIDALFTSTSATCVTGLTTIDVASNFTEMGKFFIMLLIQVGGIGVMTITSFFALFFVGSASLSNQSKLCDMVNSKSVGSLFTTLMYILTLTLVIELIGAVLIFLNIQGTMGMTLYEELAFSVFHSISAFCNAGFSTLPENLGNAVLMEGNNMFFVTISFLIILGGIGFPILVNIVDAVKQYFINFRNRRLRRTQHINPKVKLYHINTRIVVVATIVLLVVGTLSIALFEWNRAFAGMSFWDKVVQSFFNSVSPRTAGFSSVPISGFGIQTLLIIMMLMVIGGGTQSTAGGIKVNVFAVALLNLRAKILGYNNITVYKRELSQSSINSSNSTIVVYLLFVFIALFVLTILEPEASVFALLFEAVSALSTVGSSLDLTPTLGSDAKIVIIVLMFVGRIGVLAILSSLVRQRRDVNFKYPSGDIIIN